MNKFCYIENDMIQNLLKMDSVEPLSDVFTFDVDNSFLLDKLSYIKEFAKELNSEAKFLIVKGYQGTGKTSFVFTIDNIISRNVFSFYFDCSQVSSLDDIIFNLYKTLCKSSKGKSMNHRMDKHAKKLSIDEKIINILKNFKSPFLFIIDSADYLIEDGKFSSDEVSNFFSYLLTLPTVKIVLSSKTATESLLDIEDSLKSVIRFSNVDETDVPRILSANHLEVSNHLAYQVYEASRGYPYNLILFAKSVNLLGISPFDILKEYASQKLSFEQYLAKSLYSIFHQSQKKLLWYLSALRHDIPVSSLKRLAPIDNIETIINTLKDSMLIMEHCENISMKEYLKNLIYDLIPEKDKIEIHKFYNNLYAEQIPLNPFERLLNLSRATMHSEKYYHYSAANRIEKNYKSISSTPELANEAVNNYVKNSENIKYVTSVAVNKDLIQKQDEIKKEATVINTSTDFDIEIDESKIDVSLSAEEIAMVQNSEENDTLKSSALISDVEPEKVFTIEELINNAEKCELNNDYKNAIKFYNQALKIAKDESNNSILALLHHKIGVNLHKDNANEESINSLQLSKDIYLEIGDLNALMLVNLSIGRVLADNYRHDEAIELFEEVLESPNHPANNILTEAIIECADIYEYKKNFSKSRELYNRALQNSIEMNNKPNICKIYFKLGLIDDDEGSLNSALDFYKKSLLVSEDHSVNLYLAPIYSNIASILEELSKLDEAIEYYKKSLNADVYLENYLGQYKTLSILGNIYFEQNDIERSINYFQQEIKAAKLSKDVYNIATSYLEIGDVYFNIKQYGNALKAYIIARKSIGHTVSTDSKEKIERRFKSILHQIGDIKYKELLQKIRKK